jgi:hypothetical protein
MPVLQQFAALVAHPLVKATCQALNIESAHTAAAAVSDYLRDRFTDHSQRLIDALHRATERAWKTLELALAGRSFTRRLARAEDAVFLAQVDAFLASLNAGSAADQDDLRQHCLVEAQRVRSEGLLREHLDGGACVEQVSAFARFANPADCLDAEWRALGAIGDFLSQNSCPHLGKLLKSRPHSGQSVLAVAVRYFFRREVVRDEELHREHVFAQLGQIKESQDAHFSKLEHLLITQGHRFDESLDRLAGEVGAVISQLASLQSGGSSGRSHGGCRRWTRGGS